MSSLNNQLNSNEFFSKVVKKCKNESNDILPCDDKKKPNQY